MPYKLLSKKKESKLFLKLIGAWFIEKKGVLISCDSDLLLYDLEKK